MRQRDYNKRKTGNRDMYNAEGYKDMTAYLALRNIEREERAKRHKKHGRGTAAVAPVLSDYERMGKEDEQYFHEESQFVYSPIFTLKERSVAVFTLYHPDNDR